VRVDAATAVTELLHLPPPPASLSLSTLPREMRERVINYAIVILGAWRGGVPEIFSQTRAAICI